jgi:hypothetical protein
VNDKYPPQEKDSLFIVEVEKERVSLPDGPTTGISYNSPSSISFKKHHSIYSACEAVEDAVDPHKGEVLLLVPYVGKSPMNFTLSFSSKPAKSHLYISRGVFETAACKEKLVLAALSTGIKNLDNETCISVSAPFITAKLSLCTTIARIAFGLGGHLEMLPVKVVIPQDWLGIDTMYTCYFMNILKDEVYFF